MVVPAERASGFKKHGVTLSDFLGLESPKLESFGYIQY